MLELNYKVSHDIQLQSGFMFLPFIGTFPAFTGMLPETFLAFPTMFPGMFLGMFPGSFLPCDMVYNRDQECSLWSYINVYL